MRRSSFFPGRRALRRLPRLAALAACATLALPSAALAGKSTTTTTSPSSPSSCSYPATSQSFLRWGDTSYYYLASGGAMETMSWSGSGGSIVAGNEPWYLASTLHKNSLRLPRGASVTSPKFCVSAALPHLRFVAKAASGEITVRVDLYNAATGKVSSSHSETLFASSHLPWAPTRFVSLDTGGMAAGETANATVTITSYGDWLVDDVFVDPYRS